jgi:hypothetical protein
MKAPHPEGFVPHRGYSRIGKERSGLKAASETDDEAQKAAFLTILDYKVRSFNSLSRVN